MKTNIRYLKLSFRFPVPEMRSEVAAISADWKDHYNARDYEGKWTALPLRSVNGSMDHVIANGDLHLFQDTPLLRQCPVLKTVIDTIQCDKKAVRLLNLQAGAIIKEHTDKELSFESGEARIHVPIVTSDAVDFYLDGERVVMDEGTCWYMDFNRRHRVVNGGTTDRIHLVMDCVVNDWLRDQFCDSGPWELKSLIPAPEKHDAEEKRLIIERLREMNTPSSLRIAHTIEQELASL